MTMIERIEHILNTTPDEYGSRDIASLILGVMRAPTDEMMAAQERAVSSSEYAALRYDVPDDELLRIYTAMIDAALAEPHP